MKKYEFVGIGAAIPRRQFLILGSAAVVGVAATSLSAEIVRSTVTVEDIAPRLSVAFVKASLADFASNDFAPRSLTVASHLRSGDPALAGGVRMKVHGIVRTDASRAQDVSMGLDAMYRVDGRSETVPFMAWSYAQLANRTADSAASQFVVPVGARNPLSLSLFTANAQQIGKLKASIDLSLGSERRANKLRSGTYFLVMCPKGMHAPDWSSIRVVPSEGNLPLLRQATLVGHEAVPFDYIVISTDRA
jgi:hypothetical protein